MAGHVPGAVGVVVEEAQVVAVLVDGLVGEAVGARAVAAGEAVGGAGAVVVALVVDRVVEAGGTHEHAEVFAPAEVGFSEEAGPVVDQAALVEGVVTVIAVRVARLVAQLVVAVLESPGQAIAEGGVPVDLDVGTGVETHCVAWAAQPAQQAEQGEANRRVERFPGVDDCCFYHRVPLRGVVVQPPVDHTKGLVG
ncbi:hypothetical protein D3C80_1173550 [compost metagenome]